MWGLANGITAFAIIQMIAYLTAIGTSPSLEKQFRSKTTTVAVLMAIGLCCAIYAIAVIWLGSAERSLIPTTGNDHVLAISKSVTWARVIAIALAAAGGLAVTWLAHSKCAARPEEKGALDQT